MLKLLYVCWHEEKKTQMIIFNFDCNVSQIGFVESLNILKFE